VGVASAAFFQAAERAAAATDRARFTLDDARSDVQIAPPHAWAMAIVVVALKEVRFISHWSPYDPVRVVNAVP
jgi:hypothetical protein